VRAEARDHAPVGRLITFALLAIAVVLLVRRLRGWLAPAKSRFPCATCANCRGLFDDGAICAFGARETFKNETHIANCHDYRRGRAG
jgi:hypothetical protein